MSLNLIDTSEIKISNDMQYVSVRIGKDQNHPVIVVDNFLEDPDYFLENIVSKVPLEKNREQFDAGGSSIPGYTGQIFMMLPEVRNAIGYFIDKFTDFEIPDPENLRYAFQVNALDSSLQFPKAMIQPHVDPAMFAFVLYMNKEVDTGEGDNYAGGTAFYSHKTAGCINMEHVFVKFKREEPYWNYKEWEYDFLEQAADMVPLDYKCMDPVWTEIHEVPMKYNRLVLYPSYLWHSAKFASSDFKDRLRVSVSGFVDKDYFL